MNWPGDAQCAVALTFDLDGEVVWTSKIPQDPAFGSALVRSMGRFGPETAMPRILELLGDLKVRAGVFVVGKVAERYPELVKEVHRLGHEVGHHSYSHVNPAKQKPEETWEEFSKAQHILHSLTGKPPRGFRSPAADMSSTTWKFLAEFGFAYDSSLMTRELPYICGVQNRPIVELPFHWMLDDWPHFGFNMYPSLPYMSGISSQEKVYEIWLEEFEGIYEAGLLFMLVMHPQLMGRYSRLRMLARLLKHIQSRGKVWIATPGEIAAYWLDKHNKRPDETIAL